MEQLDIANDNSWRIVRDRRRCLIEGDVSAVLRIVNAHDALVNALKKAMRFGLTDGARAALKLTEGGGK